MRKVLLLALVVALAGFLGLKGSASLSLLAQPFKMAMMGGTKLVPGTELPPVIKLPLKPIADIQKALPKRANHGRQIRREAGLREMTAAQ